MSSSLADQVRSIAHVTTAIAQGDLTQKIEIEMKGEMLTLKGMGIVRSLYKSNSNMAARYCQFNGGSTVRFCFRSNASARVGGWNAWYLGWSSQSRGRPGNLG